jgi:hypothetical protein
MSAIVSSIAVKRGFFVKTGPYTKKELESALSWQKRIRYNQTA